MPLSPEGVQAVKTILDGVTSEGPTGAPGLVFVAVDKSGEELVSHAAGNRGINSTDPMDFDTIFWIASMTKMVTATAAMQLHEQGKLPLDDADFVAKVAPEIKAKQVYADGVNGAPKQKEITMRMLLAHTAGFAYAFWDPRPNMVARPVGINEFNGDWDDFLESPLCNQPGTMWEYGINIDWVGIIIERVTGQRLNDYFLEHIWAPLGVTSEGITMFPNREQKKKLTFLHQRDPATGELKYRDHYYRRALIQDTKEKQEAFFQSGGGGLFAKPKEYIKLLAVFLNDGTSPTTGKRLLKKETVDKMWENQIPEHPNFARGGPPPQDLLLANATPEMYPQSGNPPQGWGISMFLTLAPGDTGRGANTGFWAGIANTFWWVDREKGVAGVIAGNVLPFGDPKIGPAWFAVEKAIYDHLK